MPVPKRKVSRSRRDKRQANKHLNPQTFLTCKTDGCSAALLPHRPCTSCGMYKGVQVEKVKKAKEKTTTPAPTA